MILVLFHVLYLVGKYVYDSYIKKQKIADIHPKILKMPRIVSEEIYAMIDPEAPQDYEPSMIRFSPPAYIQRYTTVSDILFSDKYKNKIRKVVDFGCADLSFLTYLKNIDGIEEIICVDIDRSILEANKDKAEPLISEYIHCRAKPLIVHICEGSITSKDRRLEQTDAVICIELIEHLDSDTLIDFPFNIFAYIEPKAVVVTTPNADFNILFSPFSGLRHPDHKFEWTRKQFQDWAHNIILRYPDYQVTFHDICNGPEGTEHLGACTQMAIFHRNSQKSDLKLLNTEDLFKVVASYVYPFKIDNRSDEQKILDEAIYYIRQLSFQDLLEELPLKQLLSLLHKFNVTMESLRTILEEAGWNIVDSEVGPIVLIQQPSTFSDYSAIEDNFLDEEKWNEESGPPLDYYNEYINRNFTCSDIWTSETWEEEPSIIIPQNNSIMEETNTYMFDVEHELPNFNCPFDRVNIQEFSSDLPTDSILQNVTSSPTMKSYTSSDNNIATKLNAHNDNNEFIITNKVNRSLNFHPISASCSSISPQPLSIHLDRVNSFYHDDTIITDKSILYDSLIMNKTFHSLHTLEDQDLEKSTANYVIPLNKPLREQILSTEDQSSHFEKETADYLQANIKDSKQIITETEDIYHKDHSSVKDHLLPSRTNICTTTRPKCTSSPCVIKKNKESKLSYNLPKFEKDISSNIISNTSSANQLIPYTDISVLNTCQTSRKNYDNTRFLAVSIDSHNTKEKCVSEIVNNVSESKRDLHSLKKHSSLSYQNTTKRLNDDSSLVPLKFKHMPNSDRSNIESRCHLLYGNKISNSRNNDITLQSQEKENISSDESKAYLMRVTAGWKDYSSNVSQEYNVSQSNTVGINTNVEVKPNSPEPLETPPGSWSPEIMDSGYPNSVSAQDMTPEYDLSSIAHDQMPDSESPSVAEAPQLANLEPVEVENGDLANNNRDNEGNNMVALVDNNMENLQPFINVLENDLENENDIYVVENGFPIWLLRILEMANPIDINGQILRDHRELFAFNQMADHDEGFNSSSSEEDGDENNDVKYVIEKNCIDNDNEIMQDTDSEDDNSIAHVLVTKPNSISNAGSDEWIIENT